MRRVVLTVVGTLLALVVLGLVVIFTGGYNVAATEDHWPITVWALTTLQENSIGARADEVTGTIPTGPEALGEGLEHYDEMCVTCHGAPGVDRGELGQGMTPRPPNLSEELEEWSDPELFWIVKHGMRLAGMPAFGPTHSDESLWNIVAFLREMQEMTAEEYASRVEAMHAGDEEGEGEEEPGHTHAPGTPEHSH